MLTHESEMDTEPQPSEFLPKAYLLFLPCEEQTFPAGLKLENKSGKMVRYKASSCATISSRATRCVARPTFACACVNLHHGE